ncbi:regulatory YrvL family protein [Oceanobacillus alkalisoli]|uniref:regulatory YrvL family protein n=1 Tax=Oceanobacillus alkalisoli TaxID=2925113 RepID=UPI001F1216CF|nr:regulatory YrvL family protein [Oceanobacillus alkalisoli]MCF3942643.1 regulatory YrvL family protein [Oceanobacillus alkalisoli]
MPESNDDSFRNMNKKEKIATVVGIALLILFVAGFIFGLYFFGLAGVFKVLGVQYDSVWSLAIFVVNLLVIGLIFEVFSNVIFKLSVRNMTGKAKVLMIRFLIEAITNWVVIFTVDELMRSITLSLQTEIIIAIFIATLEIVFDDKDTKKNTAE